MVLTTLSRLLMELARELKCASMELPRSGVLNRDAATYSTLFTAYALQDSGQLYIVAPQATVST